MVTVTLTGTPDEVHSEARSFFGIQVFTTGSVAKEVTKKVEKIEPKEKVIEKTETKVEKTVEKTELKETAKETAEPADLELEIKKLIPQIMAQKDRAFVVQMLERYGAKKGSDIKPVDQAKFIAEAKTLLPKEKP